MAWCRAYLPDRCRTVCYRDCLTVTVCPAIVIVPVRLRGRPVYGATEKVTVPFPLPLSPPVMVIQEALLWAVHGHPVPAVTITLPVPPSLPKSIRVGGTEYVQATIRCTVPPRPTT